MPPASAQFVSHVCVRGKHAVPAVLQSVLVAHSSHAPRTQNLLASAEQSVLPAHSTQPSDGAHFVGAMQPKPPSTLQSGVACGESAIASRPPPPSSLPPLLLELVDPL